MIKVIGLNNFYLSLKVEQDGTAWFKSTIDMEHFLDEMGFHAIPMQCCKQDFNCLSQYLSPTDKDAGILLVQSPRTEFEGLDLPEFIRYVREKYGNYKLAAVVHDLDSVRYGDFFVDHDLKEAARLNLFDYLISLNDNMTELLKEQKMTPKIFTLKLFDYVLKDLPGDNPSIAFAGNLQFEKSAFLYDLYKVDFKNVKVHLYGPGLEKEKFKASENISYFGSFSPDDLPFVIKDKFGLCWEGNSLDHCGGKFCKYMKYGNPHKTSLYLAMGLPVIISKDIGAAAFVEKEHVGITISSLHEIPERLNQISDLEYKILRKNCLKISSRLRNGYYIKQVIDQIKADIQETN